VDVSEAIQKRRAYRSLDHVEISGDVIRDLAYHASLAPSCYNNQPWRFVFVRSREKLNEVFEALPEGNAWATRGSMIVAVYSRKDLDCVIDDREYYLFDTGMATAFLILRATELGLVAHPIAGYSSDVAKRVIGLSEEDNLISLIIIGRHSEEMNELLTDWQREQEIRRPERLHFDEYCKIL